VSKFVHTDSTRSSLLSAAEHLVRTRGYSAISYADLAEAVGIRKASVHHHFPGKADLGGALMDNYIARFGIICESIEQANPTASNRMKAYGKVYAESLSDGRLCLCGMLATELSVLPDQVAERVRSFFTTQLKWLQRIIAAGQAVGELNRRRSAKQAAEHTLSTLQGSMLLAWATGRDPKIVSRATDDALQLLQF
jgi:TetR/AcrR family transcriptional regulator, transcriptional repressor for nem operon